MSTLRGRFSGSALNRRRKGDDQVFMVKVITAVKPRGCLYDRSHPGFNNQDAIDAAWRGVAEDAFVDENGEPTEIDDEAIQKVQHSWDLCKKHFSKERSRRESPGAHSNKGWPLYQDMFYMDAHIQRRPRAKNCNSNSSKKRKLFTESQPDDDHPSAVLADDDLQEPSTSSTHKKARDHPLDRQDSSPDEAEQDELQELRRREKDVKAMEERAEKARALRLKQEKLEVEREESRRVEELRKQEEATRRQELMKKSKKEESEKKRIQSTADYVVATLDSLDDENERRALIKKIMNILYG